MTIEDVEILGQSSSWLSTLRRVSAMARLERPCLIIGERGTGKELIAARLHYLSTRWNGAYETVNCGALSEQLLDSELFGHETGAFTGATQRRSGRFERAHQGSLFLDELATASMQVQEKLLRAVEYGQFQRLGGEQLLKADVRLIAATNIDLPSLVKKGKFRADLLDRLAFDVITLPPLRAREGDITLLAEHFAYRFATTLDYEFEGFAPSALNAFEQYEWPGNVRELKNTVERIIYRAHFEGKYIPVTLEEAWADPFHSPWRPQGDQKTPESTKQSHFSDASDESESFSLATDFETATRQFEMKLIDEALAAENGRQTDAAKRLGLTYHQLRGLLRKYDYPKLRTIAAETKPSSVSVGAVETPAGGTKK